MEKDFFHHTCHTCGSTPKPVHGVYQKFKSCSSCKLISYCSVPHQREDWPTHKSFCLQIRKITKSRKCPSLFDLFDTRTPQSLYQSQQKLALELELSLGRQLAQYELSSVHFPDICGSCLRPNGKSYIFCDGCRVQFYCSNDHKISHDAAHRKDCASLKLCFSLFKDRTNCQALPRRIRMKQTLNPLARFPASLDDYCSKCLDADRSSLSDRFEFTEVLSYVTTLVYAVLSSSLADRSSLTVHIIGASVVDTFVLLLLEHFYRWLDAVELLDLAFFGPECLAMPGLIECTNAKHGDRLSVAFYEGVLYHTMRDRVKKPDMIVAFDCGFHEYEGHDTDTWLPTINYILTMSTVLVTTSYTPLEAEKDAKPFLNREPQVRTIKFCEKNPFCSLNPRRNPERTESGVFFFNQMLSIFSIEQDKRN